MRKLSVFLFAMTLVFGVAGTANSALWDRGGGLIYDDVLDITWLQDTNYAGGSMSWDAAVAWTDGLEYYDSVRGVTWDDWRLPDAHNQDGSGPDYGYNVTGSELGHMFYDNLGGSEGGPFPGPDFIDGNGDPLSFQNLLPDYYWSGTEYGPSPGSAWLFSFSQGLQSYGGKDVNHYAWAVRPGDSAAVPIPSAIWLLGSGLVILARVRRKFGKAPSASLTR